MIRIISNNHYKLTYVYRGKTKVHQGTRHDEKVEGVPGISEVILTREEMELFWTDLGSGLP